MREDGSTNRMLKARVAQSAWAHLMVGERARRMRSLRRVIAENMDEIVRTICEEVGKHPMDALAGDLLVTLEQLRFYERHSAQLLLRAKQSKPWFFYSGARFVQLHEPHGVVLVFAPWNYPFQLSVVPMATALFAGNAVLLKCSERTPRIARLIARLCSSAGLPEGLVQVSCEAPDQAAALLEAHPDFVFFTGSGRNGVAVAQRLAAQMIPAVFELGGKDAAIVFESCDLNRTVNGVVYGSFSNAGQVCVGTKRIYVQDTILDEFLRLFLKRIHELGIGATTDSDMGSIRFKEVRQRLIEQVDEAVASGAKLHTEYLGRMWAGTPIVLTDVPEDSKLLLEEIFGPVVCLVPFKDEMDAIRMANSSTFQLSASAWTGDAEQGERVASQLQSGTCTVNDVIRSIGNPACSFGGNRASGYGRYHGAEGLLAFSRVKTVMTLRTLRPTEIHWFPFQALTFTRVRELLMLRHKTFSVKSVIKSLSKMFLVLIALGALAAQAQSPPFGPLSIDVTLPPHARGQIVYLLFADSNGFPGDRTHALRHGFIVVSVTGSNSQHIEIGAPPPGRYAVSVYLDENGDRKLNSGWLGIPKEPVGASNNPKSRLGPPRFDDCAFDHDLASQTIPITLVH